MSKLETSSLKLRKGIVGKKETKEITEASQVSENLIKYFQILLEIQMGKPIFNT